MVLSAVGLEGLVPRFLVAAIICVITLVYLALVDFLYMARLAAYLSLIQMDDGPPVPQSGQPDISQPPTTVAQPLPPANSSAGEGTSALPPPLG